MRILVVDDHADSARALRLILRSWKHEARAAHSGEEARRESLEFRPDVILLDLRLPGVDGVALAEELRREPGLERVRFIAVTGQSRGEDFRRTAAAGFEGHLTKPVEMDELRRILESP